MPNTSLDAPPTYRELSAWRLWREGSLRQKAWLFGGWAVLSTVVFMPEGIAGGLRKKRLAKQRAREQERSAVAAGCGRHLNVVREFRNERRGGRLRRCECAGRSGS